MNEIPTELRIRKSIWYKSDLLRNMILYPVAIIFCSVMLLACCLNTSISKKPGIVIFICIAMILMCVYNLVLTTLEYRIAARLDADGIVTLVPLKEKKPSIAYEDNILWDWSLHHDGYFLEYGMLNGSYTICPVSKELYEKVIIGEKVAIRYLSDHPEIQRVEDINVQGEKYVPFF